MCWVWIKPLAGRSFQVLYDDGPGRPGGYFSGDFVHRFLTAAEAQGRPSDREGG